MKLANRILRPAVAVAARYLDDAVPPEALRRLLQLGLNQFEAWLAASAGSVPPPGVGEDMALARRLAARAGVRPADASENGSGGEPVQWCPHEFARWLDSLPDGKVVTARRLYAGSGRQLDLLDASGDVQHRLFCHGSLEALLRHVEIQRRRSLATIQPDRGVEASRMERLDIAILLARAARRRSDPRFLNAALKLNDWAYRTYRRLPRQASTARYLLALAEQEVSLAEIGL